MFCMLTAYMDESYNNRTMSVGGWLCHEKVWPLLEGEWRTRILYENRISQKKDLKQLSRYHAADCASCVGEFEGWSVGRQIRLTKKLIENYCEAQTSGIRLWRYAKGVAAHVSRNKRR